MKCLERKSGSRWYLRAVVLGLLALCFSVSAHAAAPSLPQAQLVCPPYCSPSLWPWIVIFITISVVVGLMIRSRRKQRRGSSRPAQPAQPARPELVGTVRNFHERTEGSASVQYSSYPATSGTSTTSVTTVWDF